MGTCQKQVCWSQANSQIEQKGVIWQEGPCPFLQGF